MRKLQLSLIILINVGVICRGELFTALADIEPLLTTQKRVIDDLNDYITSAGKRLHVLRRYLTMYEREHTKAMEDIPDYLGNPINAFILIKRMTIDLEFIQLVIDSGAEHAKSMAIMQYENTTYPSAEDLGGAAVALTRLQETYLLKTEDLADGILNGAIHSSKMSAGDCYELGKILFNENNFRRALKWMMAALRKYNGENNLLYAFEEMDILQYLSLMHNKLGNNRHALKWKEKILEIDPHYSDTEKNTIYQGNIENIEEEKIKFGDTDEMVVEEQDISIDPEDTHEEEERWSMYEALCRGEVEVPSEISKQLKCLYYNDTPFLKLSPIKMEYKYINPDIVLFHEVLSDEEIETMKKIAQPRFQRAQIYNEKSHAYATTNDRISKSAWLVEEDSPVVAAVSRRISDFTGLSMVTAEDLQVVNYGIGGHYLPHFDFARMSDVAEGGATVFTELGLSLFPVRGSAAVWFNLHPSGEGDLSTIHAACPVLCGSKWVSNKWIHLLGQEFLKPCGLEYQAESFRRRLMKPVIKYYLHSNQ